MIRVEALRGLGKTRADFAKLTSEGPRGMTASHQDPREALQEIARGSTPVRRTRPRAGPMASAAHRANPGRALTALTVSLASLAGPHQPRAYMSLRLILCSSRVRLS